MGFKKNIKFNRYELMARVFLGVVAGIAWCNAFNVEFRLGVPDYLALFIRLFLVGVGLVAYGVAVFI